MKILPILTIFPPNYVAFDQDLGLFCISENKIENEASEFLWGPTYGGWLGGLS